MSRILMFGCKNPLVSVSPEETLERDLLRANSGNLLFNHSAYRSLAGNDVTVSDFTDVYDRPGWVNRNFDHVVLPFANAFRTGFAPRLDRFSDLIEKLRVPVTVLGVGAQSSYDLSLEPLAPLADTVTRFVRSVLERSPSVGVRGEFTARYLNSLGFSDVEVIGCPSMFINGAELQVRTPSSLGADDPVAVTAGRRDGPWMGELLERARAEHDLVYIPQATIDLELMLWGEPRSDEEVPGVPVHLNHPLFREDKARFFVDTTTWVDYLTRFSFCFGSRIHGNVAALLAGTPAHVIPHDSRTLELAEYFEIPHTPASALTSSTTARDLLERSDYGPLVGNHGERFDRFVGFLDQHALPHILRDPAATARFDQAVAEVVFPPAVRPLTAEDPVDVASRLHRVRDRQKRQEKRLRGRIRKLEAQLRDVDATPRPPQAAPSQPPAQAGGIRRQLARLRARAGR